MRRFALLLLAVPILTFATDFKDPAPPTVNALRSDASPVPAPQSELTYHAVPQPLAKDAVTTDSPGFLGSTHSPLSPETHLRQDLKDLPIVWETEKGTGYAAPSIAGERLILFHRIKDEEVVDCLQSETGQRSWRFAYPTQYQ